MRQAIELDHHMALTRPLPLEGQLVANYIRKLVPRPAKLPEFISISGHKVTPLGWDQDKNKNIKGTDPLGLLPKAIGPWPTWVKDFRGGVPFSQHEMVEFFRWWDDQEDAQAAVDVVWGQKTEEKVD